MRAHAKRSQLPSTDAAKLSRPAVICCRLRASSWRDALSTSSRTTSGVESYRQFACGRLQLMLTEIGGKIPHRLATGGGYLLLPGSPLIGDRSY